MLDGFDCDYPWFVSQARAPEADQVAVATRPFRMPDSPRNGPNSEHDAIVMAHAQGWVMCLPPRSAPHFAQRAHAV